MRLSFSYNGQSTIDQHIVITDYPKMSGGENQYDTTGISGRLGELVGHNKYKTNITIEIPLVVLGKYTRQRFFNIREWLAGSGKLRFSDSPETFYKVIKASYKDLQRGTWEHDELTASFLCEPYEYREDGRLEYAPDELTYNPYSLARPIYKITGEGQCTLTVNDNTMTANVGQNLTIDTGLMIAYREDGTLQNTKITGDYEKMRLPKGELNISISGGKLKVIPNWGYEI